MLVVLLLFATFGLWVRGAVPCDVVDGQPACKAQFLPGPALDALDVVDVAGDTVAYTSTGELVFTTVRVDTKLNFGEWLKGLTDPTIDMVDRDLVIPPGQDETDVADRNAARMDESQAVATFAALHHLGYPPAERLGAQVQGLAPEEQRSFAEGEIRVGDVITGIDGTAVADAAGAVEVLSAASPGDTVTFDIARLPAAEDGDDEGRFGGPLDGAERLQVTLTLRANPDDETRALVGVLLGTRYDLPIDVGIDAGEVGGPSAGLMFALAIVDRLTPDDLTSGAVVAGTGTITSDGRVGPIGGIRQKVVGAIERENGGPPATVFLTPADQVEEARTAAVGEQILLVPVATLDEAVTALRSLADGDVPSGALAIGRPD